MPTRSPPNTGSASSTSASLLVRVRERDPRAWTRLVELYSPLVYSWTRRCGLQASDSADVLQEVFRAVHRGIDNFRRDRPTDSFRGWLWTVTRNKVRDFARRAQQTPDAAGGSVAQQKLLALPDREPAPEESGEGPSGEETSLLSRGLELVQAEFEERTWRAFWRCAVDGADTALVAEELGITPSTVRTFKSRVLKRLREELADLLDDPAGG